ncbi:MAG: alpha/beta hydrolase [Bacteroidota bacterium]
MEQITIHTAQFPQLGYRKVGSGPSIVLLHGFPANGELWQQVWTDLAASFTVIVPDIPGSGASTFSGEKVSMEQLADSVKLILDHEGIRETILFGHSMGGYIALAFADKYGTMLRGLSLVHSTALEDSEEKKELRLKSIELLRKGGKDPFVRQMIPGLFAASFCLAHPDVIAEQVNRGLQLDVKSMIAFYFAMRERSNKVNVLRMSKFPIQWIMGKKDNIIPYMKALEQSHLNEINFVSFYIESGHMSMLENPTQLKNDIAVFSEYCYKRIFSTN